MFFIGSGNYVKKDMIVLIGHYDVPENKRKCRDAASKFLLTDYSRGKKKNSVVVLSDGQVFISPLETATLINEYGVNDHETN